MRHVDRIDFCSADWNSWVSACNAALRYVASATDRSKAIKSKQKVYKEAAPFLKVLFGEKCAYCESPFDSGRLEVEHFRPKLGACDQQNKAIRAKRGGREHRGYYWLAFSWKNLLPGCTQCNQLPAKANKFPLREENKRAWKPKDIVNHEDPLLLDPCVDYPERHLEFDTTGDLGGKILPKNNSDKGKISIDVYKLNRDGLIVARLRELFSIEKAKNYAITSEKFGVEEFKKAIADIRLRCDPMQPYSALWLAKTQAFLLYAEERLKTMTQSLP